MRLATARKSSGGEGRQGCAQTPRRFARALAAGASLILIALSGCANRLTSVPPSEGHITAAPKAAGEIPRPVAASVFGVPAPKPTVKAPTYSVVVNDVPVKELLQALARDTKQNIDIHPSLAGLVSINAINETLPAILDRITRQVNMRYRRQGNAIVIEPDTPYSKTYRVNYVNMTRNTQSAIGVSGQISGSSTSGQSGGGTSGGSGQSVSTSAVSTTTVNEFWKTLESSVRSILSSSQQQILSARARAERLALFEMEQKIRLEEARANAQRPAGAAAGRAGASTASVARSAEAQPRVAPVFADDVIVNPIAGTVTITATDSQHRLVQEYLEVVQRSVQRQVLIEATIVEVTLSEQYQAGVDWSRLQTSPGHGITFEQALLAGALGTPPTFVIGYSNPNSRVGDINIAIRLLEQFGNARVLSSPKLMALNNQTALLKVVDNVVYFEVKSESSVAGQTGTRNETFTTTANTVAIGVVMTLTPQISESNQVNLTVRPTISRILGYVNDPNPVLAAQGVVNRVPEIQTREMESVLQVGTGQTVILGGLMQDDVHRNRDQIPGADRVGSFGELLRYRDERAAKTELVVFLRPTVIANPSLESDDLKFYQRFLPQAATTSKPATTQ